MIAHSENIVEQQPDSALRLLQTILFPEKLNKSQYNKYYLILLEAKDKSYKDITSDTIIFAVKDYYIQKKDYSSAALAAYYCGRLWHERNDMEKAVDAYIEAENLADNTNNYNLKGLIQSNLGILHWDRSSYEKSIELSKNAVGMYHKAQNYKNEIGALILIGNCFVLNNKIDSAFYYYNRSLILADSYNLPKLQSDIKQSMGIAYREQGFYDQAKKFFIEALAFPKDSVEQARILLNIAQIYVLTDNIDSVKFYLNKSSVLQINNPSLIRTSYFLKFKIEEKNNHYSDALNDYKEYYRYTTKVFDSEKNNKLLEIQEKYDYEKLRNSQNQLIIKHQKALIVLSLILLASSIIIIAYYRKSAQNRKLLLESEHKIEGLQKSADRYFKKERSFQTILLKYIGILRKTTLLEIDYNETKQEGEKKLLSKINNIIYEQDKWNWDRLYQTMNDARSGLYNDIRIKHPQLTETEFRVCCLTCESCFSDKEIEKITGENINKIRRIRSELRKKIGMAERENFLNFFTKTIQE